jgi:uncharacterized protein (TIGR02145 family)
MKHSLRSSFIILLSLGLITILNSCKKVEVPTLTTLDVTNITTTKAVSGGNIAYEGSNAIIARGVCWSIENTPTVEDSISTDGFGTGSFISVLSHLNGGTTYYVRAYGTNSVGTAYGQEINFTTSPIPKTVADIDGNIYNTVIIGTQVWMVENLKTTKYNDGIEIPHVTDFATWKDLTTPAYCWYNNDETTYKATYGALYNWHAVNIVKLCPTDWHVSTAPEWSTLILTVDISANINHGMSFGDWAESQIAGGKLKATGTPEGGDGLWHTPNEGATDEFGFTALPSGERSPHSDFGVIGTYGSWWTSTEDHTLSPNAAIMLFMHYGMSRVEITVSLMAGGYSVRCLMDN